MRILYALPYRENLRAHRLSSARAPRIRCTKKFSHRNDGLKHNQQKNQIKAKPRESLLHMATTHLGEPPSAMDSRATTPFSHSLRQSSRQLLGAFLRSLQTAEPWWVSIVHPVTGIKETSLNHVTKPLIHCLIRALWRFGVVAVTYFCF